MPLTSGGSKNSFRDNEAVNIPGPWRPALSAVEGYDARFMGRLGKASDGGLS
jgi:hypothetical protein